MEKVWCFFNLPALVILMIIVLNLQVILETKADQKNAFIFSSSVICKEYERYIGWPTITRTGNGELIAVFSGDRDEHVCPWGKTQMVRSSDNGNTWDNPVTINNTPLDDRDAGIIETMDGTLIVTWFTSLAFMEPRYQKQYPIDVVKSWQRHIEKLNCDIREKWLGCWIRRSTDGGRVWGEPIEMGVNSPHGPIQLNDGRILYVGKTLWANKKVPTVVESHDDGRTWKHLGTIPVHPEEKTGDIP